MQVQKQATPPNTGKPLSSTANEMKASKAENPKAIAQPAESKAKDSTSQASSAETTYMRVVSRLEHLVQENKLQDGAIDTFTNAVKNRINRLNQREQKAILALEEVKALEVKNIQELYTAIGKELKSDDSPEKIMTLLKDTKFAEFMNSDQSAKTYSPQLVANSAKIATKVESSDAEVRKEKESSVTQTIEKEATSEHKSADTVESKLNRQQGQTKSVPEAYQNSELGKGKETESTKAEVAA